MSNQVSVNQLLKDFEGRIYRVIGIDEIETKSFLYELSKNSLSLIVIDLDVLNLEISTGDYRVVEEVYKSNVTGREMSYHEKKTCNKAWDVIKGIYGLTGEAGIFNKQIRSAAIKEISKMFEISDRTAREYLKRYFERGMIKEALLPDNRNSGRRSMENNRINGGDNKGDYVNATGIIVDENVKKIFMNSIDKYYNSPKKISLRTAYELMIKEYFRTKEIGDNGEEKIMVMPPSSLPTYHQFRYWHYKNRDMRKEILAREGSKNYNLQNRSVLYDSTQEAIGPGHLYQIDETLADFYLVSSYDNQDIVGRPSIYLVIDVFTRMVCGVSVTLRQPSFISAAMAILNTSQDKKKFCEEFGIEITQSEWPCKNLPMSFLGDRGELEGSDIENIIEGLGVKVSNTASYRGDMKPFVERYLGLLQDTMKPFLTGVIREDFQKRGAPDYRLTATLNLHQFIKVVIKTILYFNNSYLPTYERDESMIRDGVAQVPTKLWEWGIKNRSGRLKYVDEEILKYYLLPRDKARVTMKGIEYKGVRYSCDKAFKERWFERAREKGSWEVEISYDPRISDYICILDKGSQGFQKCTIIKSSSRYSNKSFYDIDHLMDKEKEEKKILEYEKLQAKVDLIENIERIVDESISDVITQNKARIIKKSRLKDIKENRTRERVIEDDKNGFRPLEKTEREEQHIYKNDTRKVKDENISDDLFRIQEEMFDDR